MSDSELFWKFRNQRSHKTASTSISYWFWGSLLFLLTISNKAGSMLLQYTKTKVIPNSSRILLSVGWGRSGHNRHKVTNS